MFPVAALYLLSIVAASARTHSLPQMDLEPAADLIKLVSEVDEEGGPAEERDARLFPLVMTHDSWRKSKDWTQDNYANTVDDLKQALLKLAAVDKLRSHSFLRSEQTLPKANKRACFWKYCVTN